uniref:Poly [ADP-ribose] polymerase n=1 Tax=Dicentrarchus labrax TaxID=13489 RepID=A0A8P4JZX1_DICLA
MNLKGQLKPGDCVITGAGGQLCCQKVIHAVGPQFDQGNPQKALAQLKRAVKGSLELAETHGCISVALPAISRSQGFPLSLCATTIIKAVKEHCDDKYGDNTLKKIHFVNNDDSAVQAMDMAVRQEYGNHGVSHSQQTLANKDTKSPPVKRAKSDSMCLGQVQTKEGMVITVTKGNIENATVTVNTVFEDLTLTKGAVSNAIFRVAGPKLQQLVTAKNANGKVGEVIVTDGCQLKSKQVFHAITPHWDNGQGAAEKVVTGDITKETTDVIVNSSNEGFSLKSGKTVYCICAQPHPGMIMTQPGNLKCKKILHLAGQTDIVKINKVVKEALQMCVTNSYTSVSFPAIGTGELHRENVMFIIVNPEFEYLDIDPQTHLTIIKIERIQNPVLWKSLQLRKRDMELRNGHQNNEKRLFHGTCHDTVAYINNHGFNRSYAGKNAACYGNGTYFAVNASYSASNTYSKPNQNGEKCMYLCRVLTGDFTLGQQNMIVPPAKGAVSVQKYDSVVDNVARPSMYVIFHDTQAYPEYLITFK